jgi:hypothetical protein
VEQIGGHELCETIHRQRAEMENRIKGSRLDLCADRPYGPSQ